MKVLSKKPTNAKKLDFNPLIKILNPVNYSYYFKTTFNKTFKIRQICPQSRDFSLIKQW